MAGDEVMTLRVRGDGGSEWDMDVPPVGSHARENFDARIANGQLQVVGDVGDLLSAAASAELIGAAGGVERAVRRTARGGEPVEPVVAPAVAEEPSRVGAGSSKEAWADYAASKGIDTTGKNRAELMAAVDAFADES